MDESPDIDTLGIKALKELITSAGLSTDGCIDKDDLRARAREALAAAKSKPAAPPASGGGAGRQLGGYPCIVKGPADLLSGDAAAAPADLLVIVLHGLGASNRDFEDIPQLLYGLDSKLSGARIVSAFPQAPMGNMGAAWWSFDVGSFMQAQMMPDGPDKESLVARLIRQMPPGLEACRKQMATLVTEARALAGGAGGPLAPSKILLGGFSLGSITALDVALQMPKVCAHTHLSSTRASPARALRQVSTVTRRATPLPLRARVRSLRVPTASDWTCLHQTPLLCAFM